MQIRQSMPKTHMHSVKRPISEQTQYQIQSQILDVEDDEEESKNEVTDGMGSSHHQFLSDDEDDSPEEDESEHEDEGPKEAEYEPKPQRQTLGDMCMSAEQKVLDDVKTPEKPMASLVQE